MKINNVLYRKFINFHNFFYLRLLKSISTNIQLQSSCLLLCSQNYIFITLVMSNICYVKRFVNVIFCFIFLDNKLNHKLKTLLIP